MKALRSKILVIVFAATMLFAGVGGAFCARSSLVPKRFAEVEPDRLYRSGDLSPGHLAHLRQQHGIRTVLSLLNPDVPESQAEREAAEALGIQWINIPLRGDGSSTPADREKIEQVVRNGDLGPMLVHCSAGVNRTGLAVGLYRIEEQGWTYDQVLEEMLRFDFENLEKHENLRGALREAAEQAQGKPESPSQ